MPTLLLSLVHDKSMKLNKVVYHYKDLEPSANAPPGSTGTPLFGATTTLVNKPPVEPMPTALLRTEELFVDAGLDHRYLKSFYVFADSLKWKSSL